MSVRRLGSSYTDQAVGGEWKVKVRLDKERSRVLLKRE
jgi:hypothetical protein